MKFQRAKDLLTGVVVSALVFGIVPTAFAKVSDMTIPVSYKNIKIVIDGQELKTDKEPFIYDGTTYLPVRAVGEAVGKTVGWDGAANTVTLSSGENVTSTEDKQTTANGFVFSTKHTTRVENGWTYTVSEITNNSGNNYSMVEIEATYYGSDGTILGTGSAYVYDLLSGQTKSFETMESGDYGAASDIKFQTNYVQ